MNELVIV